MLFKVGIRHVMRAADKTPFSAAKTAEQLAAEEAERAAAEQRAKDDAILKHTDDPKKLRVKWFKYNQVELARVMSREHADNVYPPKIGSSSLTMQRVVRGFLARKRLRWQRQLELRRELVKAQEQKMRQALPHKDKVLLDVLSERCGGRLTLKATVIRARTLWKGWLQCGRSAGLDFKHTSRTMTLVGADRPDYDAWV